MPRTRRSWSAGWRLPQEQADRLKFIAEQRRLSATRILEEAVDTYLHTLPKSDEPTRV